MPAGRLRSYATLLPIVAGAAARVTADRAVVRLVGASPPRARRQFQAWCRVTCRRLGIRVEIVGAPAAAPCLYVANHRSYLDIPLLGGVLGSAFVSRADVAAWRVVGYAARSIGTVFLDRDDPRSGARAARAIGHAVRAGQLVVFPEGTTGGERLPRPFADGLFRLLERLDAAVVPVTVRYSDRRAYWTDELTIGAHLRERVLGAPLGAAVHLGAPLRPEAYADAEAFTDAVYRQVCDPIERYGELAHGRGARGI